MLKAIEITLKDRAQCSAVKNTFQALYVSQRSLISLSAVIIAEVRERREKQLADRLLSFKLTELYAPAETPPTLAGPIKIIFWLMHLSAQ